MGSTGDAGARRMTSVVSGNWNRCGTVGLKTGSSAAAQRGQHDPASHSASGWFLSLAAGHSGFPLNGLVVGHFATQALILDLGLWCFFVFLDCRVQSCCSIGYFGLPLSAQRPWQRIGRLDAF